ncbi:MAG TPA: glycosyltransferase family 39 protein [Longimicrobiaceae bacterium]|nr:glycosyltransferase family 39 protein [Longimicrobiaceae bacterium]
MSAPGEGGRSGALAVRRPHASAGFRGGSRQTTLLLLLAGVTLLALVMRVIALNAQLWLDEMFASMFIQRHSLVGIVTDYRSEANHTLYSILAELSIAAFGAEPWSLRLPAVLFGAASVPLLYLLGSLVSTRREALLAAALLSVSYHHIWFSQNARGYTMVAFFTIAAIYFLLRGLREQHASLFIGYAVMVALATFAHRALVLMVAGHFVLCVALLLIRWNRLRRGTWRLPGLGFALAGALTLLLFAPALSRMVQDYRSGSLYAPVTSVQSATVVPQPQQPGLASEPPQAASETGRTDLSSWVAARWHRLRSNLELGAQVFKLGVGSTLGLALVALLFACGAWSFWKSDRLFLAAVMAPGLFTFGLTYLLKGDVVPRYGFFLVGGMVLIIVRGGMVLGTLLRRLVPRGSRAGSPAAWGTALVLVLIGGSVFASRRNYVTPKMDFLGALAYVEAHRGENDPVVVLGRNTAVAYLQFYGMPWQQVRSVEELDVVRAGGRDLWLLFTLPRTFRGEEWEVEALTPHACIDWRSFKGTLGDGDLRICRLPAR